MKTRFKLLLIFLFAITSVYAQKVNLSGTVTSAVDNLPLPGVSVIIKGTNQGTSTDFDGKYAIAVNIGDVLEFSSVGSKTVSITVGSQTVINVALQLDSQSLDEIVVIGYGTQRKADLTGAITTIQSEEIERTPTANVIQSLQGKVAGVQIVSNGSPGDSPTVRLRGLGTYTGAGNPLYVVDGMYYENIDFLNTSDIESFSVLKDASSSAIFGVRAAGGVIIITTKSGKTERKPQFTYNGYTGYQVAQNVLKMANAEQFVTMAYESGSAADIANVEAAMQRFGRSRVNPNVPNVNTDWFKEILRPATISSHSIGVDGGSENVTYSVGANYFAQEGILDMKNEYERFNIRSKVDVKVSDRLRVGTNSVFSNATKYNPENGAWFQAYFAVPILPVYDYGNEQAITTPYSDATLIGYRGTQNPFPVMRYNNNQLKIRKLLTSIYAEYFLVPEKLSFKTMYNHDLSIINERNVRLPYFITNNSQRLIPTIRNANNNYSNQFWDNTLTYKDTFGNHNLTVLVGTSYRDEAVNSFSATGANIIGIDNQSAWYLDFADDDSFNGNVFGSGRRIYGLSYFGRVEYNYKDKYLINATNRYEGTSAYTKESWRFFPSVGLGWVVTGEDFMNNNGVFDFLKLRASWGELGNDRIGGSAGTRTISTISTAIGDILTNGLLSTSNFSNLEWEVLEEKNFGISARMFDNRLSLEADYYIRDTKNAIIPVFQPIAANFILDNVGKIRNEGFELALNWSQQISEKFSFSVGGNITTLENKVMDLNGQPYLDAGSAEFRQRSIVGEPIRAFFGYETTGVYQNDAQIQADPIAVANNLVPGDLIYKDQNGDGIIDDDDRVVLGSHLPNLMYGGNINVSYSNFDLSVSFAGQSGNKILNRKRGEIIFTSDTNMDADLAINRWHGEGTSNTYPSSAGLRKGWNQKLSNFWIEDGGFFRIQNIQLSYTIKSNSLLGKRMPETRISLTAERPLTLFNYNGFNPEVADGVDRQTYPIPAIYTVGVNIKI